MLHDVPDNALTLGADLRALRKLRGLTLVDMAGTMERSVGWLSQVERGLSDASITDLRHMAKILDVSVSSLFKSTSAPEEQGHVVRAASRRPIGNRETGLVEALLSPDLTDDFEVVHSTFEPHSQIDEAITRATQEVGYIVSGGLEMWINGKTFTLTPGDSFRVKGEPFRWRNPHGDPCIVIWVIAPPVY